MGRLVDCQVAIVSWGQIARFRRSKLGLMRKGQNVFLTIFSNVSNNKFLVDRRTLELLPAAIRLGELGKDLFVKCGGPEAEQRYKTILRQIKIILNRDKLSENGKANLDLLLSNLPTLASLTRQDTQLKPLSVHLRGSSQATTLQLPLPEHQQQLEATIGFEADGDCCDDVEFEDAADEQTNPVVQLRGHHQIQRQLLANKQLQSIKINGLESIPKEIWSRPLLLQLTLSDCKLTNVPKQLEHFARSLKFLDLSHNRIDNLPRAFCCKMNSLTELNLSNNKLETLPIEIKFFHRLVDLNISDNRLRMLPSTFSDLRMLRKLNVANNNLSQLPAFRTDQIRLDYLDVSYNPLDGASDEANTFEVYPSNDGQLGYHENLFCPLTASPKKKPFPKLFEIAMLNVVRCDELLKLASEESLPKTIVLTMQRDIFKCYKCSKMNILPAYNSTDILDYVEQVRQLVTTGNYRRGMTFMKLICSNCFDQMRS